MATYYRDDQTSISLTVDGIQFPNWDEWDDGNLEADTVKYRTLQAGEIDLGGPASRGDMTLSVQSSDIVVAQWWPVLERRVGKGKASAALKFTGPDGNVQVVHTRVGVLKGVKPAGMNRANQSPGRHIFQVVLSLNELAVN